MLGVSGRGSADTHASEQFLDMKLMTRSFGEIGFLTSGNWRTRIKKTRNANRIVNAVCEAFERWLCKHDVDCTGPVIAVGRVIATSKKNHAEMILPGQWMIRECNYCHERFSRHTDMIT